MANHRTQNAADLGALLAGRKIDKRRADARERVYPAELVELLQKSARILHRHAERQCNGEVDPCGACNGSGWKGESSASGVCPKCTGTGDTLGGPDARRVERLRVALKPYRLHLYEQGDPRGWPLYLIPAERIPARAELERYTYDRERSGAAPLPSFAALKGRWIASNYSSAGVAVCPH